MKSVFKIFMRKPKKQAIKENEMTSLVFDSFKEVDDKLNEYFEKHKSKKYTNHEDSNT